MPNVSPNASGPHATYIPPACVGPARLRIGSVRLCIGSTRVFRYQHVGKSDAKI